MSYTIRHRAHDLRTQIRQPRPWLQASLDRLGRDYVDLYLIHRQPPRLDRYVGSFRTMVELTPGAPSEVGGGSLAHRYGKTIGQIILRWAGTAGHRRNPEVR